MVEGRLVSVSLDCYLVMELGEDGDLFNLRHAIVFCQSQVSLASLVAYGF